MSHEFGSEEPARLLDDPSAPDELRLALASLPGPAPLDAGVEARVRGRLERSLMTAAAGVALAGAGMQGAEAHGAAQIWGAGSTGVSSSAAPGAVGTGAVGTGAVGTGAVGTGAVGAGTSVVSGGGLALGGLVATKVVTALALVAALGAGAAELLAPKSVAPGSPAAVPAAAVVTPAVHETEDERADTGEARGAEDAVEPPTTTLTLDALSEDEPEPTTAATPGLAREVELLRAARAALESDSPRARALLDEYLRAFPNGALRTEYESLRERAALPKEQD